MCLNSVKLIVILSIILIIKPTSISTGTVEEKDVANFEFFWSNLMSHIPNNCDQQKPGTFHRNLLLAMKGSDCQSAMDHWKSMRRKNIYENKTWEDYGEFFDRNCANISRTVGSCWNSIVLYMMTCYRNVLRITQARYTIFEEFLRYYCFGNDTLVYKAYDVDEMKFRTNYADDDFKCFDKYATLQSMNQWQSIKSEELRQSTRHCVQFKAITRCHYEVAYNTSSQLGRFYQVAFDTMKAIVPCDRVAAVQRNVEYAERNIRVYELLHGN